MSRENSPFRLDPYWLDKRRDGKSPGIWQIATYPEGSRAPVYRSTKCRDLEAAKNVLRAHDAAARSKQPQAPEDAELLPHLFNYLREQGPDVLRLDTIESSFRAWIGFLAQDELGTGARVSDINKVSVDRFRRWRMKPHSWEVPWKGGKVFKHQSKGVTGEAVQRNIEDLRAALNHAEAALRLPMRPKIPSVKKNLRSPPRSATLSIQQLGAIVGYANQEPAVQDWLWLMLGTACRPDAGLAFDSALQVHGDFADLHPPAWPRTDKRNPVVPIITPLAKRIDAWTAKPVRSRKRWWRTMRTKLGIAPNIVPKTIRHTVASFLRGEGVPGEQISGLLGHKDQSDTLERTTAGYAHANPAKMRAAMKALTTLWKEVDAERAKWLADHSLTITGDNNKILVAREAQNG